MGTEIPSFTRRDLLLKVTPGSLLGFLAACSGERPVRRQSAPPSNYPAPAKPESSPAVLAMSVQDPLATYLRDVDGVARTFINGEYLNPGVKLSRPDYRNFGLRISNVEVLDVVVAVLHQGVNGRQAFAIENRYRSSTLNLVQARITAGTIETPYVRADLIPGRPFGKEHVEGIPKNRVVEIPNYVFRFPLNTRWSEARWGVPNESTMTRNGSEDRYAYVVRVSTNLNASLVVEGIRNTPLLVS